MAFLAETNTWTFENVYDCLITHLQKINLGKMLTEKLEKHPKNRKIKNFRPQKGTPMPPLVKVFSTALSGIYSSRQHIHEKT